MRHDHWHRPLPQGPEPGDPDRRRRPGGVRVLGRIWQALSRRGSRRGLLPDGVATRPLRRHHRRVRRGELPHRPTRVSGRGNPHRRLGRDGCGSGDPDRPRCRSGRHRRRAQPGLGARLPVPGVRRRLDGDVRIRPRVRHMRRGSAGDPRGDGRVALRQPRADRADGDRRDEVERDQPAPRVQEHAALRQCRGVRVDRRARRDGSDLS